MIRLATIFTILLSLTGFAPAIGQNQNTFQDVLLGGRAYRDMQQLCDRGLLPGYAKGHFDGRKAYSRYQFAVALDRALKMVTAPPQDTSQNGTSLSISEVIPAFARLVNEFKDDLHNLGYVFETLAVATANFEKRVRAADQLVTGSISIGGSQKGADRGSLSVVPAIGTNTFLSPFTHIAQPSNGRLTLLGVAGSGPASNPGVTLSLNGSDRIRDASLGISYSDPFGLSALRPQDGDQWVTGLRTDALRLTGTFGDFTSDIYTAQVTMSSSFGAGPRGLSTGLLPGFGSPVAAAIRGGSPFGEDISDRVAGVSVGFGVKPFGEPGRIRVNAASAAGSLTQSSTGASNVVLVGTNADFRLNKRLTLSADYGRTITGAPLSDAADPMDASAYNLKIGFNSGGLNVMAGYRYIDPLYYAPGYWGRIGGWMNPSNISGPSIRADIGLGRRFGLNLGGDFYTAAKDSAALGGLGPNDDVNRVQVGLRWDISKNLRTTVDWEGVYWHLSGARGGLPVGGPGGLHPTEHFITLGTGYSLTSNMLLRLTYQIGDFNGQGLLSGGLGRSNFSAISSEVAIKF